VREKWYYHDTESGQEMMTGPNSTDAPIMRLIDRNGNGSFADPGEEQHFVNDHQGSTVLVTGKATLDPTTGNLISRAPIIAHVKYDQYGVPKFVHPADVNSDGVVDAADDTFWKAAWNEYVNGASGQTPPKEIWKGVADANENGAVDSSADPVNSSLPSSTNTDWLAFHALHTAGMIAVPLDQQLGNLPLYAGYWWDDAIGLYHVRHRVYRPEWGRWLQRDPLGYAPGWNLYQYVNDMPWSAVDPMGLFGWGDAWNIYKAGWIGAWEGAVILADEVTFHAVDSLHDEATRLIEENGDSHLYGSYAGKVFREATIAAVTVGVGSVARGGMTGTGILSNIVNGAARSKNAVQAARYSIAVLSTYDVASGGSQVGDGIVRITEGDSSGLFDVGLGLFRIAGGLAGAKDVNYYRDTSGSGRKYWRPLQDNDYVPKTSSQSREARDILKKYGHDVGDTINHGWGPQMGRHPSKYDEWVVNQMREVDRLSAGDPVKFRTFFDDMVKDPVRRNPNMLRKCGWE
jgi:RHS repeat-associated protein